MAGGVLYVEPVYIRGAGQDSYPLLQKVLAGYGTKVAFKDTSGEALAAVLGTSTTPTTPTGNGDNNGGTASPSPSPSGTGNQTAQQRLAFDILRAQEAYTRGQDALGRGDFAAYGEAQKDLKRYLDDAAVVQRLGLVAPSSSPTAAASPPHRSARHSGMTARSRFGRRRRGAVHLRQPSVGDPTTRGGAAR